MGEAIHRFAVVEAGARLGKSVRIGAFAFVGSNVVIGDGCHVEPNAVIQGDCHIGEGCCVGVGAALGGRAQIRGDVGRGALRIGARNRIGEYVTMHCGGGIGASTIIGEENLFMAYTHVGHDATIGDRNELANGTQLAGHVEIADDVTLGGLVAVHQCVRIGRLAMVGGGAMVSRDIPPFACASGDRARVYGVNSVGLQRAGVSGAKRELIRRVMIAILRSGDHAKALDDARRIAEEEASSLVEELQHFVEGSERGIAAMVRDA